VSLTLMTRSDSLGFTTLTSELDTEKATAELADGVLKLHIPKAEHAKPRRIEVNTP